MLKNPRHEAFCQEYHINGFNGLQAYKAVYGVKNEGTAKVNANKLLTNANIQARLEELQAEAKKKYNYGLDDIMVDLIRIKDIGLEADTKSAISAIQEINKIQGNYAPTKSENTNKNLEYKIVTNLDE